MCTKSPPSLSNFSTTFDYYNILCKFILDLNSSLNYVVSDVLCPLSSQESKHLHNNLVLFAR